MIEFRLARHSVRPDALVVELWFGDNFIGQIAPGEKGDPTIRIISKHPLFHTMVVGTAAPPVFILEVTVAGA